MFTIILTFLKTDLGKYIAIGGAFLLMLGYFNIKIWALETSIKGFEAEIVTLNSNLKTAHDINKKNKTTTESYKKDVEVLKENQGIIVTGKDKEITRLKKIIVELKKPVPYPPGEVIYKECKVKIKKLTEKDKHEDTILYRLNNIGF